jgi:uncharacterized protein YcfJ
VLAVEHDTRAMNKTIRYGLALAALAATTAASAQITFYEHDGFRGRQFNAQSRVDNFARAGFNDRASSVIVTGGRWEVCADSMFQGPCMVLRPGQYPSLSAMGLNDRVSSARIVGGNARVDDHRYAPAPVVSRDFRRRNGERMYQADVIAVHAVVGPPEQRCWVERERVEQHSNAVPGGVLGAVVGGILGHQIGGGTGRDLATVGGVVGGAVVGSQIGRQSGGGEATREVQRCAAVPSQARPDFWDVTYNFRGQTHHVQLTAPPGPTITVNRDGEPRS